MSDFSKLAQAEARILELRAGIMSAGGRVPDYPTAAADALSTKRLLLATDAVAILEAAHAEAVAKRGPSKIFPTRTERNEAIARAEKAEAELAALKAGKVTAAPVPQKSAEPSTRPATTAPSITPGTMTRSAWQTLAPRHQAAFVLGGGRLVDSEPTAPAKPAGSPPAPLPSSFGGIMPMDTFRALTPAQKAEHCRRGGKLI